MSNTPGSPNRPIRGDIATRRAFMLQSATLAGGAGLMAIPLGSIFTPSAAAQDLRISRRPGMVTPEVEKAIDRGHAFLARTQARDGSWRTRSGYGSYPVAMTALAGLGMLAGGNTPVEGKYAANVRKAVEYVLKMAERNTSGASDGLIAAFGEEQRPMYGHGFSMLFLGEVYGMERDPDRQEKIENVLKKAITLTGRSQSQMGGWLYTPDSGGDEGSVTITQVQGLRSVRNAGIKVPKKIIDNAIEYIEKSANSDGGIRYRASGGGSSRAPITAAAVAVLYNAGQYEHPVAKKSLQYIKNLLKGKNSATAFGGHNYYATLYAAQAMYLSSEEDWKSYFPDVRDYFLRAQNSDGSWTGDSVGETYGTAVALIVLQLPYARLPILQR